MAKESFIMRTEWLDTVQYMDNEEAGVLLKIILNYEAGKDLDEGIPDFVDHREAFISWTFIRRFLEMADQKYEDVVEKKRQAGKAGAEKRWKGKNDNSTTMAQDGTPIAKDGSAIAQDSNAIAQDSTVVASDSLSVSVSVSDIEREKSNKREKDGKPIPATDMMANDEMETLLMDVEEPLSSKIREWVQYRKTKSRYGAMEIRSFIANSKKAVGVRGMETVIDVISQAIANGYNGIVWKDLKPPNTGAGSNKPVNSFTSHQQNRYDIEALEKALGVY